MEVHDGDGHHSISIHPVDDPKWKSVHEATVMMLVQLPPRFGELQNSPDAFVKGVDEIYA